ncbi:MAG: hypothetical protein DMF50_02480 [Acidobacteria bacterium]|nr:MAG: hypothetical protein DMF50_02480 [Acidobacteriota bacterium]
MRASVGVAAACLAAAVGLARAEPPALTDLKVVRKDAGYVASCRLAGWPSVDLREEIAAGLETSVNYRLQVYQRRGGLPDILLLKRRVRCTVRHDALTRQYTLTRFIDGELQDTRLVSEEAAMRDFMTALAGIPLLPVTDLPPGHEYYLKAKSDVGLVWRFYLIPWTLDTAWARVPIGVTEGNGHGTQP